MKTEESPNNSFKEPHADFSNLLHGMMLSAIITGYIIGPLLIIGGGAFWLYRKGSIGRGVVIAAVIAAFIISNVLIVKRAKGLIKSFNKKTGIIDPTPEQVKEWEKDSPKSYKYDDADTK